MTTTKTHYNLFKSECNKWVKKLELSHWNIGYRHEKLSDSEAQTAFNLNGMVATITLNTDIDPLDTNINEYIKECAKHEVIHILCGRLTENANARFVDKNDLYESVEELVTKLTKFL